MAKVCLTDNFTIELMINELVVQMAKAVENGSGLRMNMKVGYFICRGGVLQFQQSQTFHALHGSSAYAPLDSTTVRTTSQTVLE